MTGPSPIQAMEELDSRESNGFAVSLLWHRRSNRLNVLVEEDKLGESFTLTARPDNPATSSPTPTRMRSRCSRPDAGSLPEPSV